MFSGLTFCPSGVSCVGCKASCDLDVQLSHVDCAKLWTMVQYNGGKWQKKLDSTVTHLVTCNAIGVSKYRVYVRVCIHVCGMYVCL